MNNHQNIAKYIATNHPDVFSEASGKLRSDPCSIDLVERIVNMCYLRSEEIWKVRLTATTTVLLICSPESIHTEARIRKGVATLISCVLDITKQAVSNKLDQCRHYYSNNAWLRDTVNEILEEVRGDE